jgi:UDP:flavonoid glycosyltransferase YjiC (YdhE family)
MAKILVASMPFAGHVGAMTAVTAELTARGHHVIAYTGAKYQARFTALGATWLPWTRATDFDDADLAATFPQVGDGKGFRGTRANGEYVLFGTTAGQIADILAGGPYDLLVTDQVAFGGAIAGQKLGIPWATVAVTPLSLTSGDLPPNGAPWPPATSTLGRTRDAVLRRLARFAYRKIVDPRLNRFRADVGLGPVTPGGLFDAIYSSDLIIAQGVPGLEYLRSDLPPQVHFVGRLATTAARVAPSGPAGPPSSGSTAAAPGPATAASAADVGPALGGSGRPSSESGTDVGPALAGSGRPSSESGTHVGPAVAGSALPSSGAIRPGGTGEAGEPVARPNLPDWWSDLDGAKAVVHVTQGTLDTDPIDLLKPALAGLADQDLLVVCTTGGADPAILGTLPANARVAAFIPHDLLLPRVDVMVTNGGWGGVLAAIQAGVPLVVAGSSLDKPEVARRVAWSGAGVNLRTGRPAAARVGAAVREVLADPAFRTRARELGAAMTAAGGSRKAGDLIEQLLTR